MTFLEPAIFLQGYLKPIVDSIVKSETGKAIQAVALYEKIINSLSDRDAYLLAGLNEMMSRFMLKKKHYPLKALRKYTDYRDQSFPNACVTECYEEPDLVRETDVLRTLCHVEPSTSDFELNDLIEISHFSYRPFPREELVEQFGENIAMNPRPEGETRLGLIVYVNEGIGDVLLGNDEFNKHQLITSIPEHLYRYILDTLGDQLADRSFLSVTRLF